MKTSNLIGYGAVGIAAAFIASAFLLCHPGNKPKPVHDVTPPPPPALTVKHVDIPPPPPLTVQQIIANTEAASVLIKVQFMAQMTDMFGQPIGGMQLMTAGGSGWFSDNHGDIVTANHVANDTDKSIVVTLPDGTQHNATIVYETKQNKDFTVLHIDVTNNKFVKFGDSDKLQAGDPVLVIGYPFMFNLGSGPSASSGIVSNPLRSFPANAEDPTLANNGYVQIDAAINHGNSGGPVVNARTGDIIGLADWMLAPADQNAGVNFIVPSNVIEKELAQWVQKVKVSLPTLNLGA
ncbi:MAG: trypsin-like peptidase domain-containing protein [Alphaproteobacteria bacterium]